MLVCVCVSEAGVWVAWEDGVGWGRCRIVGRWVGGNQIAYHGTFLSPLLRLPVRYYAILFVHTIPPREKKQDTRYVAFQRFRRLLSLFIFKKGTSESEFALYSAKSNATATEIGWTFKSSYFFPTLRRGKRGESATFRTTSGALTR